MKPASPEATASAEGEKPVNPLGEPASKPKTDSDSDATSDSALVSRVQEGDEAAFRELFDRYHRRAFAVAFGVVKNKQDALDIVQDGFIKVHRHIGNFQGSSSFYTWLYRIVMNLSIDHVRRNKKGRDLDYDDRVGREADEVAGDGTLLPRILDGNPSKTVLRKELTEAIQKALDELPDYHRAVILLREVEGLSYEEMASVLKVPKGTIMSRLFHARRKMQHSLSEYLGGDLRIEE
jgi:RNA polymerase sigma-70 factor (ECF subfamily)